MLIQTGVFDIPKVSLIRMPFNLSPLSLKRDWYYLKPYLPECNVCYSHPHPHLLYNLRNILHIISAYVQFCHVLF